jgi:hypothetical protein
MVAGPSSTDPYELLAERIKRLEMSGEEQGRRSIPDTVVPMFPMFVPNVAPSAGGSSFWTSFDSTSEKYFWAGRIGEVWHPKLYVSGNFGYASGSGTATYRAWIENDEIGSWSETVPATSDYGPFDISPYMRQRNLTVLVSMVCSTNTGSAQVRVALLGCLQRRA